MPISTDAVFFFSLSWKHIFPALIGPEAFLGFWGRYDAQTAANSSSNPKQVPEKKRMKRLAQWHKQVLGQVKPPTPLQQKVSFSHSICPHSPFGLLTLIPPGRCFKGASEDPRALWVFSGLGGRNVRLEPDNVLSPEQEEVEKGTVPLQTFADSNQATRLKMLCVPGFSCTARLNMLATKML